MFKLIVNSSDGFDDCWVPFFTLLKKFWNNFNSQIFLVTENKNFNFDGLDIYTTQCNNSNIEKKLTWSECLIRSLQKIESPVILYMQEDYFIQNHVNDKIVNEFVTLMYTNKNIKYISLTDFGPEPPFFEFEDDNRLKVVSPKSKYRISTQAALWDKNTLLSYLKEDENGWMFEIFGTLRARKKSDLFLTLNPEIFNSNTQPIISYIKTGIIKGRWHHKIPTLFETNNIKIDFSKRGFYKQNKLITRKIETLKKLYKHPIKLLRILYYYS